MRALAGWLDDPSPLTGGAPAPADPLVGAVLVHDVDLPTALDWGVPLRVVSTGGAGALAGPLRLAAGRGVTLAGLVTSLRDLDDLPGNARRVVAALDAASDDGLDPPDVAVEVPATSAYAFAAAVDVLAERELTLALRADLSPVVLAERLEAALDRETAYRVTGGADPRLAVALLVATGVAWDGGTFDEVAAALGDSGPGAVDVDQLTRGRRWLRSCATADAAGVCAVLAARGLTASG